LSSHSVEQPWDGANEDEAIKIDQNLYRHLSTKELEEFFAAFCAKKPGGTLLIYSNEPWIPWELLYPWQSGLKGSDFLCANFDMARWYNSPKAQRIKPRAELRHVGISSPAANVKAELEIRYLSELPRQWPSVEIATPFPACANELLALMRGGKTNLFHFATHGHVAPAAINVAAIAVGRDHLLITDIVGDVAIHLGQSKPIMFMNACHSSR
jgi:hypothetical protein